MQHSSDADRLRACSSRCHPGRSTCTVVASTSGGLAVGAHVLVGRRHEVPPSIEACAATTMEEVAVFSNRSGVGGLPAVSALPSAPVFVDSSRPTRPLMRRAVAAMRAAIGAIAWAVSGHAVAAPLALAAFYALAAAWVDARTLRIPNRHVVAVLAAVAAGIPLVTVVDHRAIRDVVAGVAAGVAFSGAPLVFGVWLARPSAIGGGDWKLLGALGAVVGLAAPFAAAVVLLGACLVQFAQRIVTGRALLSLGPGLAVGYVAAVTCVFAAGGLMGGPY